MFNSRFVFAAAVAALAAMPASAAVYNFSYSSVPGDIYGPVSTSGQLTTAATPDYGSIYSITAISGTRNGVAIDGIDLNGLGFNQLDASDNSIDESGFSFLVGAVSYNFYLQGYQIWSEFDGNTGISSANFTLSLAPDAVPEPAMLGLFGLGAIGLGLARRRRA